jgi:hypothetical protein
MRTSVIASGRCRLALLIGLGALVLVGLGAGAAAGSALPFAARLDEGLRAVEAARDRGAPLPDPDALFPPEEELSLGTRTVRVDHESLRGEWRAVPASGDARRQALDRLHERLRAVHGELSAAQAAAGRGGGDPPVRWREQLSEVLSRPEFKMQEAQPNLFEQVAAWILDALAALLPQGASQAVGRVMEWVVRVLAGAALVALAVILVRVAGPLFRWDQRLGRGRAPDTEARRETPEALLALAEAKRRAGDFRGAMQAMFRWLLTTLHQAGRLDYDPALTNREHLARLQADGAALATFVELSGQFELAWYALRPVGSEDYVGFRNRCVELAGGRA